MHFSIRMLHPARTMAVMVVAEGAAASGDSLCHQVSPIAAHLAAAGLPPWFSFLSNRAYLPARSSQRS